MTMSVPVFRGPAESPRAAVRAVRAPLLRVLPGTAESVGAARRMASQLLGDGDPAAETVLLVVSELVTNAILHTRSGAPGGTVTVALCPGPGGVLVQVRDDGGPSEPHLADLVSGDLVSARLDSADLVSGDIAGGAEHGYGLLLVNAVADSWGTIASPDGRITWCRVSGRQRATGSPAGK